MNFQNNEGVLLVVSGPSGVGKGTVCRALVKEIELFYSISATTRQRRDGEEDGVHYYFRSDEQFDQMIARGELLEWAEFCGHKYGTPKQPVWDRLSAGQDVLLEIDVKGAMQVKSAFPRGVFVFLAPPEVGVLEHRIRGRNTESDEAIAERLAKSHEELAMAQEYEYIVVNDKIDDAVAALRRIVESERLKTARCQKFIREVLNPL